MNGSVYVEVNSTRDLSAARNELERIFPNLNEYVTTAVDEFLANLLEHTKARTSTVEISCIDDVIRVSATSFEPKPIDTTALYGNAALDRKDGGRGILIMRKVASSYGVLEDKVPESIYKNLRGAIGTHELAGDAFVYDWTMCIPREPENFEPVDILVIKRKSYNN